MAKTDILPPASPTQLDEPSLVEPLTRQDCNRLRATERQIADAASLTSNALLKRAQQQDKGALEFLSAEAIVYFIRRANRDGNTRNRDDLFRELFERCKPYFRGQFRGFDEQEREDRQFQVMQTIVEDLLAKDDRSDYMQVRFWKYLDHKCIDVCRKATRFNDNMKRLAANYSGDATKRRILSLDEFAMISKALAKLPPRLLEVFLLRHYFGLQIETNCRNDDGKDELTIAAHFGVTGRTVRNWLKEADHLLAGFRGEE